jgi:fatty-acyl-CoA synthase
MFRQRSLRDPHRRALTFDGHTWTYAELLFAFESLATGLAALGVRRGDRVLYAGLNHPSLVQTMFAVMDLGAVFVPVDPRLAAPERRWVIEDLRPKVVVVDDRVRTEFDAETTPGTLISADGSGGASIAGIVESHLPAERLSPRQSDLALIVYTSGTTGFPKGVMYSHAMILAGGLNLARLLGTQRDDVGLAMTPMFHTAGLNVNAVTVWAYGGEIVLLPRVDAAAALDAITRYGVTRIDTVTAALKLLAAAPGFADADLTCLRSLIVGGAPIPFEQIQPFVRHGASIHLAMGMTECTVACALAPEQIKEKPDSVGRPLAVVEFRLITTEASEIVTAPNRQGEICLRGPSITEGYWNNPEADSAAFDAEGWFHTGDIGRYDDDGDLYVVGRIKDMIKTGGESVAAAEVERVIAQHPAVLLPAVIGVPHERWGETLLAVLSLRPGMTLSLDELRGFCEKQLAKFKLPTQLVIMDDIPLTASGKVAKHKVRERLDTSSSVGEGSV